MVNIACVKNKIIINVVVFEDLVLAQIFFTQGLLNCDLIVELETGFGIEDNYEDGLFSKP